MNNKNFISSNYFKSLIKAYSSSINVDKVTISPMEPPIGKLFYIDTMYEESFVHEEPNFDDYINKILSNDKQHNYNLRRRNK